MLYVPLRAVVERCGGIVEYLPGERAVLAAMPRADGESRACFAKFWAGRRCIRVSDDTLVDPGYGDPKQDFSPLLRNGQFYVPVTYLSYLNCGVQLKEDAARAILTDFGIWEELAGFHPTEVFSELPAELTESFQLTQDPHTEDYEGWGTNVRALTNGSVTVYLSDLPDGGGGAEDTILEIRLLNGSVATPRGLRIGDPVSRADDLYGRDELSYQLDIESRDGFVTGINLHALI